MRRNNIISLALLLVLGVAGCGKADDGESVATVGGSGGPSGSASATPGADALKFAQCMRANGLPDFKDPDAGGGGGALLPQGADQEVVSAAMEKCRQYMPGGGEAPRLNPEDLERERQLAKCMRDNGVPNFPDPSGEGGGGAQLQGVDINSAEFKAANEKCRQLYPGPTGGTGPGRVGG